MPPEEHMHFTPLSYQALSSAKYISSTEVFEILSKLYMFFSNVFKGHVLTL